MTSPGRPRLPRILHLPPSLPACRRAAIRRGPRPNRRVTPGNRGERLARLGDRIAELSARIQAATYELLVLIRQFDERGGWDGCVSCAQWLSWRAGLAPGAAREHVRVARALGKLPKLSDAMRRGEDLLLEGARGDAGGHPRQRGRPSLRVPARARRRTWSGSRGRGGVSTATWSRRRNGGSRRAAELRTWVDEDGMVVVRGRLTPEVGSVLRRALEAACDQARRASSPAGAGEVGDEEVAAAGAPANAPADTEERTLRAAAG